MARRFALPAIPKGEVAKYVDNPFETSFVASGWYGSNPNDVVVRPQDELLIQKGGAQAFNVYQRLLFDETVQSALVKMTQEITSRDWKLPQVTNQVT